jgi:cystathionine beta-lyase/cystathionine gamma-synthase
MWGVSEKNRTGRPFDVLLCSLPASETQEVTQKEEGEHRQRIQAGKTMKQNELHLSTRAVHSEGNEKRANRPVASPIYLSATFEAADVDEQIALEVDGDTFYTRYGNPTLTVVERTLAELEGKESALVFGSGMSAITTTLLAFLGQGDHAVFQREVYGGTFRFARELLPRFGVDVSWVDCTDTDGFRRALRDNTRLIYLESPTNPALKLGDLSAVAEIARSRGVKTFIDSTFATPFNTRPGDYGIDGVLHSTTKYFGGHSDLLGGGLAASREVVGKVRSYLKVLGGVLDPHAAYLLLRVIKTLGVRVEQHNRSALAVAGAFEGHGRVRRVFYPMLESHPQHELARRQMRGGGGVVSLELEGTLDTAKNFVNGLRLFRIAPSLGGVESLVSIPCLTSHAMLSPEERKQAGIGDSMVRLALGIENTEDLIADIENALASCA